MYYKLYFIFLNLCVISYAYPYDAYAHRSRICGIESPFGRRFCICLKAHSSSYPNTRSKLLQHCGATHGGATHVTGIPNRMREINVASQLAISSNYLREFQETKAISSIRVCGDALANK